MHDQVEVRSFESVERFRTAVMKFIETANSAMTSAEAEISRVLNWLETDQVPYWKSMLRKTAEDVEKAKLAYREKRFYKDASGARHSGIDELKILRKLEARRADVEQRALATRRTLRRLQREVMLYHGGVQQLRAFVNGGLPLEVEELRRVVEQLERYTHVAPEAPAAEITAPSRAEAAQSMHRGLATSSETRAAPPGSLQDDEVRRRTPGKQARARAGRGKSLPLLPEVPPEALEAVRESLAAQPPGRYELVTVNVSPDDSSGELYFERREPVGDGDTGWHIGPAGEGARPGPCDTVTVGRVAAQWPDFVRLMSLPAGWFFRSGGGSLERVVDPLGRTPWQASAHVEGEADVDPR